MWQEELEGGRCREGRERRGNLKVVIGVGGGEDAGGGRERVLGGYGEVCKRGGG